MSNSQMKDRYQGEINKIDFDHRKTRYDNHAMNKNNDYTGGQEYTNVKQHLQGVLSKMAFKKAQQH